MPLPTKPAFLPRWASVDVNNGPNGGPNKVEPPTSKQDDGWDYLEKPPREYFNWVLYYNYLWNKYSDDAIDYILQQTNAPDQASLNGLDTANNVSDVAHDIDFTPGSCWDSTRTDVITLAATITKRSDATWAAGNNNGGMFSGSVAASTTYHLFLIKKDSDSSIDAGFSADVNASDRPAGYTLYRRVASLRTDGSAGWPLYTQKNDEFLLKTALESSIGGPLVTTAVLADMLIPIGLRLYALITASLDTSVDANDYLLLITSPDQTDSVPGAGNYTLKTRVNASVNTMINSIYGKFRTDSNAQLRFRLSVATVNMGVSVNTHGWVDDRGRFDY